jgi:nitrate/nitrite transporter NarK
VTATVGALGAAAGLAGAAYAPEFVSLVVLLSIAGAFGASANTATARAVTSWFPREKRGFALGIRQTSVPIGGFAAALGIPPIADHWGSRAALVALAGASVVAAILAVTFMLAGPIRSDVEDPAEALRHPLRDRRVWRLSLGSSLLLCSQVAVLGFIVLFLESQRGFSHPGAGAVLAAVNVVGAIGRLAGGRLSDRLGTRLGLIRWIVLGTALTLGAAAALLSESAVLLVPALVLGGGLSMSWNGLAVATAVELAGPRRSGAALGVQQTLLGVSSVATPVVFAPFVAATSWRAGFGLTALFPLLGIWVLRRLDR